jgi:hypothetical protein
MKTERDFDHCPPPRRFAGRAQLVASAAVIAFVALGVHRGGSEPMLYDGNIDLGTYDPIAQQIILAWAAEEAPARRSPLVRSAASAVDAITAREIVSRSGSPFEDASVRSAARPSSLNEQQRRVIEKASWEFTP